MVVFIYPKLLVLRTEQHLMGGWVGTTLLWFDYRVVSRIDGRLLRVLWEVEYAYIRTAKCSPMMEITSVKTSVIFLLLLFFFHEVFFFFCFQ